jgi:hypothetical protein
MAQRPRQYFPSDGAPLAQWRVQACHHLARLRTSRHARIMQAIDVVALIQRLEAFVMGDTETMTDAQVSAALGLLDHALPSLVEIELKCPKNARATTTLVKG